MYKVAVLQNESEMLRSGYANVAPRLARLPRLSDYTFDVFSATNITRLFQSGMSSLSGYDSLIISTNSTSDSVILDHLREGKGLLEEFVLSGKGILVTSQKKLSTSSYDANSDTGKTLFLPTPYEFFTVERPKIEKDSGQGKIALFPESKNEYPTHILVSHPRTVTTEIIETHCQQNDFQRHYYRSHIIPLYTTKYQSVLLDTSYEDVSVRNLLMVDANPLNGERVVVTTMALDWAFHEELLENILVYITEGVPQIAFIDSTARHHADFAFLLTNARLSRLPYEIYQDIGQIKSELYPLHNTFIFSPEYEASKIDQFIRRVQAETAEKPRQRHYKQIYFFRKIANQLIMQQYANFNQLDLMVDQSLVWLDTQFNGMMWERGFWKTYDILMMMHDLEGEISKYLHPVFLDIKKHFKEYSYDGVLGVTCGLLDLVLTVRSKYSTIMTEIGFGDFEIRGMLDWIFSRLKVSSLYDAQTVTLTIKKIDNAGFASITSNIDQDKYMSLQSLVFDGLHASDFDIKSYTELDICRSLDFALLRSSQETEVRELLTYLRELQSLDGAWTNVVRTGHVLVFLLNHISELRSKIDTTIDIETMIYNGILFLRSMYSWQQGNWGDDLQSTTKAVHAIGLYNIYFRYSTQDFFLDWDLKGKLRSFTGR